MNILDAVFADLTVGPSQQFENLSVFPLIGGPVPEPAYDTLDAALGSTLRITETTDAGTVREIQVRNDAARPVLIIDGEELVGAKQNRTVNITILVPGLTELFVPVTCVEAGRWQARSSQFASAEEPICRGSSGGSSRLQGTSSTAGGRDSTDSAVSEFVTSIRNAEMKHVASVGAGESWRFTSAGLSGGTLIVDKRIVHASVFRSEP